MSDAAVVDTEVLRGQVREKYRAVAVDPDATYHFHTGRPLTARLGYEPPVDTFGGARGEEKARSYEVYGYSFLAHKPAAH